MNDTHTEDVKPDISPDTASVEQETETPTPTDPLSQCQSERDAWKDKYMRVQADFDNFSKRIDKERISWRTAGQSMILQDMLSIVDDFDRALTQLKSKPTTDELQNLISGLDMIHKSLYKMLESHEVKEISSSRPFDTHYHEALLYVDAPDKSSGHIVEVLQKGYTFKGQVLRPAKVSVAK